MRLGTPKVPGPYGMEPAFRLDMLSADELAGQGVSLMPAATPPSVNQGLVLNGTTQYALVLLAQYTQAFQSGVADEVSIYCEFFPDFNYDEAADRALYDGTVPNRYLLYKQSAGPAFNLVFYAGAATQVGVASSVVYGALWRVGLRNRILSTIKSGSNFFYLNGVQIATSVTAWARVLPATFTIGSSALAGGNYFDGTITDFQIYPRKLTAAEAIQLTTVT